MPTDRVLDPDPTTVIPKFSRYRSVRRATKEVLLQNKQRDSPSCSGERRVTILYEQFSINVPTTPETTPLDLIQLAANILTQDINVSNSILLESCHRLGLQRRLRSYEKVQDIMNTWDGAQQDTLEIQTSNFPQSDFYNFDLVQRFAPKILTVSMYHSQQAGEWHNRCITLLSTGQIFTSPKPDSKITDIDVVEICHLSDFDIYTPTLSQVSEVLKPPRKICYALKSQQKFNPVFLDPKNKVHFFSTGDAELGMKWYSIVQQWRSWYLLSRLSEDKDERGATTNQFSPINPEEVLLSANAKRASGASDAENFPQEDLNHPPHTEREADFAPGSLLERSYTHRQRVQKHKESSSGRASGQTPTTASIPRNALHHSQSTSSDATGRSKTVVAGINRCESRPQKPLVDLTPTFKEAPQWDTRKKGRGVKAPGGVMLVELATGLYCDLKNEVSGIALRRE